MRRGGALGLLAVAMLAGGIGLPRVALAQAWPSKPITIVAAYPAGAWPIRWPGCSPPN